MRRGLDPAHKGGTPSYAAEYESALREVSLRHTAGTFTRLKDVKTALNGVLARRTGATTAAPRPWWWLYAAGGSSGPAHEAKEAALRAAIRTVHGANVVERKKASGQRGNACRECHVPDVTLSQVRAKKSVKTGVRENSHRLPDAASTRLHARTSYFPTPPPLVLHPAPSHSPRWPQPLGAKPYPNPPQAPLSVSKLARSPRTCRELPGPAQLSCASRPHKTRT